MYLKLKLSQCVWAQEISGEIKFMVLHKEGFGMRQVTRGILRYYDPDGCKEARIVVQIYQIWWQFSWETYKKVYLCGIFKVPQ
jgi:hypothetical protein